MRVCRRTDLKVLIDEVIVFVFHLSNLLEELGDVSFHVRSFAAECVIVRLYKQREREV